MRAGLAAIVREVVLQLGPEAARAGSSLEIRTHDPIEGQFDPTRIDRWRPICFRMPSVRKRDADHSRSTLESGAGLDRSAGPGSGIAPDDQARVFERFERASNHDSEVAGLGLGLYIPARSSKRMRGESPCKARRDRDRFSASSFRLQVRSGNRRPVFAGSSKLPIPFTRHRGRAAVLSRLPTSSIR